MQIAPVKCNRLFGDMVQPSWAHVLELQVLMYISESDADYISEMQ